MNLEGRVQRLRRAVTPPVPGRARLAREARRALRRRALAARRGRLRGAVRADLRRARARGSSASAPRCPRASPYVRTGAGGRRPRRPQPATGPQRPLRRRRCACCATAPLFSGPQVERVPELQFQRPEREVALVGGGRRAARRSRPATSSRSARTAPRSSCAPASTAGSSRASRASPRSTPPTSTSTSRS